MMTFLRSRRGRLRVLVPITVVAVVAIVLLDNDASANSSPSAGRNAPTIVLVHGAWADASSWNKVAERLQAAGYEVRVPPNNLRGVTSDAADIARYLRTIAGPIVLVAHSYGGMVITNAAAGNEQVRALVYVDAFIPAQGDVLGALVKPPSLFAQDPENFLDFVPFTSAPEGVVDTYVKPSVFDDAFTNQGFSRREIGVLVASQRPLSSAAFAVPSGTPAWATIPTWAVVGKNDRIIPEADQLSMAERAGARIVKLDAPHMSMLTDARAITDVIIKAAKSF